MEGNRGRRPLPKEPQFRSGTPERPALSPAAAKVWDELIENMGESGVLKRTDRRALASLAEDEALLEMAYSGVWAAMKAIKAEAKERGQKIPAGEFLELFKAGMGKQVMSAIRDLGNRLIVQRREFGLTPSARVRIAGDSGIPAMDEWEAAQCESTGIPSSALQ